MKKKHLLLLSVLSGLLFALAWPVRGFPGLLFISLIPMIFIEDHIFRNRENFNRFSVLFYTYPGFFIWNLLTTYWIWNSTPVGCSAAILFNALFMSVIFLVYHWVRRNIYSPHSYFTLIFLWIAWEYFHHYWDLSWPWLSLGNGFASYHKWIQWYEYTGMFGGTAWVIIVNILLYKLLKTVFRSERNTRKIIFSSVSVFIFLFVPIIISLIIYKNYEEKPYPVNTVIVQPNIDPYNEQYTLPPADVIDINIELAKQKIDSSTQFVISPESAIQESIWERKLHYSPSLSKLRTFLLKHPYITYVIGASTFKEYFEDEPLSPTVRKFRNHDGYYDAYNTVFILDTADISKWYHKSKLTPGVERMPFPGYLKFLEKYAINLGGTVGSLGIDAKRKVFNTIYDSLKVSAIICYESVYGEFTAQFVRNGANLIFVVTNDGWWGDTPGYRQHFSFSKLRAIETRRSIGRSANTGISGFINQRGDALQMTEYWEPAVIQQDINASWEKTFYVKFGNYIARISAFISVLLILISVSVKLSRNIKKRSQRN